MKGRLILMAEKDQACQLLNEVYAKLSGASPEEVEAERLQLQQKLVDVHGKYAELLGDKDKEISQLKAQMEAARTWCT